MNLAHCFGGQAETPPTVARAVFSARRAAAPARLRYTRRLSKVRQRVLPVMEINPILNTIKDLSERSETIRGYL
ncbi:hypothetical protein KVG96_19285 [Pseudomonas sp. COR58]|uniref:Peptide chain release factor 2 n=1 Tax=Pseudomonas ekonensis TaxID=2842353 RepID=A0ABS6PI00_9PSED|nr:hypothetical protein [Pseudomonas ekonensis]MBV4460104.1 hypothetical protein [Pseudomonas ekonensis]